MFDSLATSYAAAMGVTIRKKIDQGDAFYLWVCNNKLTRNIFIVQCPSIRAWLRILWVAHAPDVWRKMENGSAAFVTFHFTAHVILDRIFIGATRWFAFLQRHEYATVGGLVEPGQVHRTVLIDDGHIDVKETFLRPVLSIVPQMLNNTGCCKAIVRNFRMLFRIPMLKTYPFHKHI